MTVYSRVCRQLSQLTQSQSVELDGLILLELVTGQDRTKIITNTSLRLTPEQELNLSRLVQARQSQPIAYLTSRKEFYGLEFIVDNRVLIPRPASEALVELGLELPEKPQIVYDVGTGSGCLAISYCLNTKSSPRPTLIDISSKALEVSRQNCRKHGLEAEFKLADLADLEADFFKPNSLIFANLPYLDINKKEDLTGNCPDLKAEPAVALFDEVDGLGLYRKLFKKIENVTGINLVLESTKEQLKPLKTIANQSRFRLKKVIGLGSLFTNT